MMKNFDITRLERAIADAVKTAGVSANVYNNRPKAMTKVDDFVVVKISGPVEDTNCYARVQVGIDLFAKNLNNFKNDKKLQYMYDTLVAGLPSTLSVTETSAGSSTLFEYLIDTNPTLMGDTEDDYQFTARLIDFKIIIKIAQ